MAMLGLEEQIRQARCRDPRYRREAYFFVLEALDYTMACLGRHDLEGEGRHVGGTELLAGMRDFALRQFGPMAELVLRHWGVRETADLGELVFNLVECGLLHSRPEDRREDFYAGYDFAEAFSVAAGTRVGTHDLNWGPAWE